MRILVLNPGSTSTKLALFNGDQLVMAENLSIWQTIWKPVGQ
jgi:butyrate kinase